MDVFHERCAGLDVHKDLLVACRRITTGGTVERDIRSFDAKMSGLLELAAWLKEKDIVEVVMEATGVYWIPVWNVLEEEGFKLCLVNPAHFKNVPGRKSDMKDAEWLAQLHSNGMLRPSFIPPPPQRELRDYVRAHKKFTEECTRQVQRMQKILETCNIKLRSVLTDTAGESGLAIIRALIAGVSDPEKLADLVRRRIKATRSQLVDALRGHVDVHARFMLELHLDTYKELQAKLKRLDQKIDEALAPFREAVKLLKTIPGVADGVARIIVAEIGNDMSQFPTPGHLVSWAGLCPRLDSTAGKIRSRKILKGNKWLKVALIQAVWGALRCKKRNYFQAQYHRLKGRRDGRKAVIAVAASILTAIHAMLTQHKPYRDLGNIYYIKRDKEKMVAYLARQARALGYELQPQQAA
jgi:transposase